MSESACINVLLSFEFRECFWYLRLPNSEQIAGSSVGVRILFTVNSWEIIKENALIGVGTGDFISEYKKINVLKSPLAPYSTNPHNMYVLVLVQLGIVGLLSMLSITYYQIKLSFKEPDKDCDVLISPITA